MSTQKFQIGDRIRIGELELLVVHLYSGGPHFYAEVLNPKSADEIRKVRKEFLKDSRNFYTRDSDVPEDYIPRGSGFYIVLLDTDIESAELVNTADTLDYPFF